MLIKTTWRNGVLVREGTNGHVALLGEVTCANELHMTFWYAWMFRDPDKPLTKWGRQEERELVGRFDTADAARAALRQALGLPAENDQ